MQTVDERAIQVMNRLEAKRLNHLVAIESINGLYDTIKDVVEAKNNLEEELRNTQFIVTIQQQQKSKDNETIAKQAKRIIELGELVKEAYKDDIPEESGEDDDVSNPT